MLFRSIGNVTEDIEGTDLTDTEGLAVSVLNDLHDEWLDNKHVVKFIEDFIDYSKLVFLTTSPVLDSNLYILNPDSGTWHDEVWWSNYSCHAVTKAKGKTQYNYGTDFWGDDNDMYTNTEWNDRYGYYKNGVYIEGGKKDSDSFDEWLIDASERRYQAEELWLATHEDHIEMLNECIIRGDECPVCTGIQRCLCDDTCGTCYEYYFECKCDGDFVSLTESFGYQWGTRVLAIANGETVTDDDDDKDDEDTFAIF